MTVIGDIQCPLCEKHPSGELNYKHLYCMDCAKETQVVVKKDEDTNFVCLACIDEMDKPTHISHHIVTVERYMLIVQKTIAPDY